MVSVAAQAIAGNAGGLTVSANNGSFIDNGTLSGGASSALDPASGLPLYQSGSFSLDVGSQSTLGALNVALDSGGFFQLRLFRVRNGDVTVDGSATRAAFQPVGGFRLDHGHRLSRRLGVRPAARSIYMPIMA